MRSFITALYLIAAVAPACAGEFSTTSNGLSGSTFAVIGNTGAPQRFADPTQSTLIFAGRTYDFIDSIGINVHENFHFGDSTYMNNIATNLNYLGIHRLRSSISNGSIGAAGATGTDFKNILSQVTGLRVDLVYGNNGDQPDSCPSISGLKGVVDAIINDTNETFIDSIEGPNEVDGSSWSCDGATGNTAGNDAQRDLWNYVKGGTDPLTANIHVAMRGLTGPGTISTENGFAQYADWQNVHDYLFCCFNPDSSGSPSQFVTDLSHFWWATTTATPGMPIISTETGYHVRDTVFNPTDDTTRAILIPEILMDHWLYNSSFNTYPPFNPGFGQGPALTYLFEMFDEDNGFSIFSGTTTTALPPAKAIRNLTTILKDSGINASSFTPDTLGYTISGLPDSSHSILLETSTGHFFLIVWQEPQIYNSTGNNNLGSDVSVSASSITVTFSQTFSTIRYYDVNNTATYPPSAQGTVSGATSISLSLGADQMIIEAF